MKNRFIIVGSGWRALYYVRIAKALPQVFELCAMLCRSQEKADKMAAEHGIKTTTSIEECLEMKPDFAVVVVNKASIGEVSAQWMERGIPVLCETPVVQGVLEGTESSLAGEDDSAREVAGAESAISEGPLRGKALISRLRGLLDKGCKLTVAEQYRNYATNSALLKVLQKGFIGDPAYMYASVAHEYHGASLIRAFLNLPVDIQYHMDMKTFSFMTAQTLTRYESFKDGSEKEKKRTLGLMEFANGKVSLYDFDSEQYRSPIRHNMLKIQGSRGEVRGMEVCWLDEKNEARKECLEVSSRMVSRDTENPNFQSFPEIARITFCGEDVYTAPFGECGLTEDETAIAVMMRDTAAFARGEGPNPYPFEEALKDAEMGEVISGGDSFPL